jgi:hypothetical protein
MVKIELLEEYSISNSSSKKKSSTTNENIKKKVASVIAENSLIRLNKYIKTAAMEEESDIKDETRYYSEKIFGMDEESDSEPGI